MQNALNIVLLLFGLTSCHKEALLALKHSNKNKTIAIQPLDSYDEQQIQLLQDELSNLFQTQVVILKPVNIPESFHNADEQLYSADSLVQFLLQFKKDPVVQVIGLTHKAIYTLNTYKTLQSDETERTPYRKSIRGLGFISENACIVSDYSLRSSDKTLWSNRLRKIVLHEIGHNLGLPHCADDACLMSEKNGDIIVLDKSGGSFCARCKKRLN